MATIRLRTNARGEKLYHVQVRLRGCPQQTASFRRLTDARRWAAQTESDLRQGRHFPGAAARRSTVADLFVRYRRTVLLHKRPSIITRVQAIKEPS